MMWVRLIASVFIVGGGIVSARSANESITALELCFQAARIAEAICAKLPNEPGQRLDCLQKSRAAQLECLEQVLSVTPAEPARPKTPSEATRSEPPAALPKGSSERVSPPGQTGTLETPAGIPEKTPEAARSEPAAALPKGSSVRVSPPGQTGTLETPAGIPEKSPEATRSEPAAALPEGSSERVSPPGQTGTLETPAGIPEKSPEAIVGTHPPEPLGSTEAPTAAISPKSADVPARSTDANWVISETTSPIDYSPLVTAMIRSASQAKDAPSSLAVRCRGQRTELLVRTDGSWATTRGSELRVDYQINDRPPVGLQWILSPDGKTATYKDDPVSFLQSLPDGADLKINVADRTSSSHEATFQINGWDLIRKKIGTACKWAPTTKTSSGKR